MSVFQTFFDLASYFGLYKDLSNQYFTLCMLGYFYDFFLVSADIFNNVLSGIKSELSNSLFLSGLIWVQTVAKITCTQNLPLAGRVKYAMAMCI